MAQSTPATLLRRASRWSIVWGVLLIIAGIVAIDSPLIAAAAVTVILAWLIAIAGAVHVILAFHAKSAGGAVWRVLVGVAYIAFGGYLVSRPALGVASLTLLLAWLFLIEGVLDIVSFFQTRAIRGSGWLLVDGIVTLVLGALIYMHWPGSSVWALGTLVGASMIISGVSRIMLTMALRRVAVSAVEVPRRYDSAA